MQLPTIQHLPSVDSTNEHAFRELAARRASHLDAWLADEQTAGRGRRGSTWFGAPGDSLMISFALLGADAESLPTPSVLSMTVGLALVASLERLGLDRDRLALDWPNDLVAREPSSAVGAKSAKAGEEPKLAGILIEARDFDPTAPSYVVGVGVNVAGKLPDQLVAERPVQTLAGLGLRTAPMDLARVLHRELAARLELGVSDPDEICMDYLEATGIGGRQVHVELTGGTASGRLILIEPSGLSVLDDEDVLIRFALEHVQAVRPASIY